MYSKLSLVYFSIRNLSLTSSQSFGKGFQSRRGRCRSTVNARKPPPPRRSTTRPWSGDTRRVWSSVMLIQHFPSWRAMTLTMRRQQTRGHSPLSLSFVTGRWEGTRGVFGDVLSVGPSEHPTRSSRKTLLVLLFLHLLLLFLCFFFFFVFASSSSSTSFLILHLFLLLLLLPLSLLLSHR